MSLPAAFVRRSHDLLGPEADAFLAALQQPPLVGLRVNPLKITPDELIRHVPWALEPVPWCPSGLYVPPGERPGKHPYHAAGLYYMQEPSAMAVVEALHVQPGQRVLDLAAAPGGKSTHIAGLLDQRGLLVANEVESSRIKALGENLERWGARNVVLVNERAERLADAWGPIFDRVLLDAPCSGEGMFRKNAAAAVEWSLEHVAGCAVRQGQILEQAARLVRPGGRLVYSTCTFAPEENEHRIATFLDAHPDWELVDLPKQHGFAAARPDWAGDTPRPEVARAVRLWPHRIAGEGHFVAALIRRLDGDLPAQWERDLPEPTPQRPTKAARRERPSAPSAAGDEVLQSWAAFADDTLRHTLPDGRLVVRNDQLYLQPTDDLPLDGLRVVRAGLWLGTRKPGRFEPAHALALALNAADAEYAVALDHEAALRYLQGATLERPGPAGWVLVTLDGWPLGWGRRTGGIVKNFYPKGLRWPA